MWRHLKMAKRAGRAHDPLGVAATKAGECAVECPACPQPDRNLPKDYDRVPQGVRYVADVLPFPKLNLNIDGCMA